MKKISKFVLASAALIAGFFLAKKIKPKITVDPTTKHVQELLAKQFSIRTTIKEKGVLEVNQEDIEKIKSDPMAVAMMIYGEASSIKGYITMDDNTIRFQI